VKIDQPWRDDLAGCIDHLGRSIRGNISLDGGDLCLTYGDVAHRVKILRWVDDPPAFDKKGVWLLISHANFGRAF
jgi:hypothetical protein